MKPAAFSWFVIFLLAMSMLVGFSSAQTDEEAECAPVDGQVNDPNIYDTRIGDEENSFCYPDQGERIDRVAPSKVPTTGFWFVGLNAFNWTWDHAYDFDNEDVDADDGLPADGTGHPNPGPFGGNGTVVSYNVYSNSTPFSVLSKQIVESVTPSTEVANKTTGQLPNYLNFEDLVTGESKYLAVTAMDSRGNEGAPSFAAITMSSSGIVLTRTSVTVQEAQQSYTYTVRLNDIPQSQKKVAINLELIQAPPVLTEEAVTISSKRVELSESVRFKNVTLGFAADDLGTGDRTVIVRHSIDASKVGRDLRFDSAPPVDFKLIIEDDDVEPALDILNYLDLNMAEGDGDITFQVKLNREPTDDVFVYLNSSHPTRLPLIVPHYMQFGVNDWDIYQDVTLHAVDDLLMNGARPVRVSVSVDPEDTAAEYAARAPAREVFIFLRDNEPDADRDSTLDKNDPDSTDRYDRDFRPNEFNHELSVDGTGVRFSWTARHLDERVASYIIWEFDEPGSDPTNAGSVTAVPGKRFYNHTIDFNPSEIHRYAVQPVLIGDDQDRDGNFPFDSTAVIDLGRPVFTTAYFNQVCGVELQEIVVEEEPIPEDEIVNDDAETAEDAEATGTEEDVVESDPEPEPVMELVMTEPDTDGDGVCDAFEKLVGSDLNLADTDGDGRSDYDELFGDGTDPADAASQSAGVLGWAANAWVISGMALLLASIILAVVSFVRRGPGIVPPAE
jgi:hypothetical protein